MKIMKKNKSSLHTKKKAVSLKLRKTAGFLAEKEGFEPSHRFSRSTAFRVQTLQPLGYFSVLYLQTSGLRYPSEKGEN